MGASNFKMIEGLDYIYVLRDEDLYAQDEEGKIDYDLREDDFIAEIKASLKDFNSFMQYHSLSLLDGYYEGLQVDIKEFLTIDNFDISDYDLMRDRALAVYLMELLALRHNFKKLRRVGGFSNGETIYEYAK
jgi:hypothetical protein